MMQFICKVAIVCALAVTVLGCQSPEVKSQSYTSKEDVSASRTVFISQFTVTCKDNAKVGNLFAEVEDKPLAVGKSSDESSYQVSWSEEHKNAGAGTYTVRIYDEAGYSNLRKAQRAGEKANSVKPLATMEVNHQGVWKGPWISSENVACLVALVLLYAAYSKKCEILA